MNNTVKFQQALEKVAEVAPLLTKEAQLELKNKSAEFFDDIQEARYIKVPLVGGFSAGKSSLLNVFTGKGGMLPVDTMPETAVAYEIYYGQNECVELYRNGQKIDSKPLSAIKELNTRPGDIAKVYCDSEPVKNLQDKGIILVDMPGIGSGIERHDAAIFNYVHTGTAFVLVVDADQGSLRGSILAFMHELSNYNMFPAVLVSKIDKKPEDDVADIVDYITFQLTRTGNKNPYVATVSAVNQKIDGLENFIATLNPDELVAQKLSKKLNLLINSIIDKIQVRIELRTKDVANVDEKIAQLEKEIANVKAELPADNSQADTPEKSTQDILDNVQKALTDKATDIAQMVIDKADQEEIKSLIVSIVRTEIIRSLKEESEQYSTALGTAVQESVKEIATLEVDLGFMQDFNDIFELVYGYIDDLLNLGGIWAQIAKIILPFLPNLLNWLFGKSKDDVLAEVRDTVIDKCANKISAGLQPTIFKITVENQKKIQEKIKAELVAKMEAVKQGLREKQVDASKNKAEVEAELVSLNNAIEHLNGVRKEF